MTTIKKMQKHRTHKGSRWNLLHERTTRKAAIAKGNDIVGYYYGCPLIVLREEIDGEMHWGVYARMASGR